MQLIKLQIQTGFGDSSQTRFVKFFANHAEIDKKSDAIKRLIKTYNKAYPASPLKKTGITIEAYDIDDPVCITIYKTVYFEDLGNFHPYYKKLPLQGLEFRFRAMQRLAKIYQKRYSKKFKNRVFYAKYKTEYGKITAHQLSCIYFEKNDRVKMLKNRRRGLKASLTKSMNKAKKIRELSKKSLFMDGYKTDEKFIKLLKLIKIKIKKIKEAKRLRFNDLPAFSTTLTEHEESVINDMLRQDKSVSQGVSYLCTG